MNSAVVLRIFRKSIIRVSIARTSICVPTVSRLVIGSTTTTSGLQPLDRPMQEHEVRLQPEARRAIGMERQLAGSTHGPRSMPAERMLRIICAGDSSNR